MADETVGITSTKKLHGFAKHLWMETNPIRGGKRVAFYHYRIPKELVAKALKAGGQRSSDPWGGDVKWE